MIILRKLFSDKNQKKQVTESKQDKRDRKRFVGTIAGLTTLGSGAYLGIDAANKKLDEDLKNTIEYKMNQVKANKQRVEDYEKISNRSKELMSKAKTLKEVNKIRNAEKGAYFYADKLANDEVVRAGKVLKDRMSDSKKLLKKKLGKRALGAIALGTAAGIGMDQLIKHRQKKLGIKRRDD